MPRYGVNSLREFVVNEVYPVGWRAFDNSPESARLTNGDVIVVYFTAGDSFQNPNGVVVQRYNADATPDGGPLRLSAASHQPSVTGLADGGYVVSWTQSGAIAKIQYLSFDAAGNQIGTITTVGSPTGDNDDSLSEVTGLAGGGWVIAWHRQPGNGAHDIYARAYDSAGVAGTETLISTSSGDHSDPIVTALADGSYVIFWGRNIGAPDEEVRMWRNGVESVIDGAGSVEDVTAALLPDGRLIVAWSGETGVEAAFVETDGTPGLVFTAGPGGGDPDIAVFADGNFVIVWDKSPPPSGGGHTLEGQVFAANGTPLPGSLFEHAVGAFLGDNEQLSVVAVGPTEFMITWGHYGGEDRLQGGLFTYAEAFDFVGTPGDDNFTGGNADDTAQGLGGADVLNGGIGEDLLEGGDGNDTYYVDRQGDIVREAVGGGTDIVYASASYTLGQNEEIEALSADGFAGTAPLRLIGNQFHQDITGNAGANELRDGGGGDSLTGLGGDDTYYVQSAGTTVHEAAGGGSDTVFAHVDYTLGEGVEVELLVADGFVTITGNSAANNLRGSVVADTLNGAGGADLMTGLGGDDLYFVDNAGDQVIEAVNGGSDTVRSSISWQLTAGQEIEFLTTTDAAGTGAITLIGNAFRQTITGNAGANILLGGGGIDILVGLGGDDVYYTDIAATQAQEAAGAGTDRLYTSVSYVLVAGSEIEVLSTNDYASTAGIKLTGNNYAQTLVGNAGSNVLLGGGGADLLIGLGGNDTYYTDLASVQVAEYEGGGNDTLYTSVSYVLGNGEIEMLSANDYGSTSALNLTGNLCSQTLIGNAGANVLLGGGGTDLLIGLGGNDTYYIDVAATPVIEYEGGGADIVYVSLSYTLGGSAAVETLSTNDYSSTQAINLTGNIYSQVLIGNAGANVLFGGGGVDTLIGLGGNDVYYIEVAGTQVSEMAGGGTDAIYTSISYALAAGNNVEILSSNNYVATDAINLTGNASSQVVTGNAGANTLNGGAGADTLHGMAGADNFAFTTALGGSNVDAIADFSVADDTIQLDDAIFTALGAPGALNPNAFHTGASAHDADDRILYDSATGQLLYDADGSGAGAAVQFATLASGLTLAASDFQII